MSLFSWLFSDKYAHEEPAESSGLSRLESTRPAMKNQDSKNSTSNNGQPANRKAERMVRRELLYGVVRQAMVHAGVLVASYRFKVLSLDARGHQFLVMIDLAHSHAGGTTQLAEIEVMIAQQAKARHDIIVTAVYWRTNEHVAIGDPNAHIRQQAKSLPAAAARAPLPTPAKLPPPAPALQPALQSTRSHFEPIQADEVAAFKRALAEGSVNPAATAAASVGIARNAGARSASGANKHGPQSYTLLTGFEDTEIQDEPATLSKTQFSRLN